MDLASDPSRVPTGPDEAGEPPSLKFYELRENSRLRVRVLSEPATAPRLPRARTWTPMGRRGRCPGAPCPSRRARRRPGVAAVLSNVGHHESHSATLRERGLERMPSSELGG